MKIRNCVAGLILAVGSLAAQQSRRPANDPTTSQGRPNTDSTSRGTANGSTDRGGSTLSASEKAAAYDKWSDKQKMEVAKGMGHDWSKMSTSERANAVGKMTPQEKSDAYDYHSTHNTDSKTTTNP